MSKIIRLSLGIVAILLAMYACNLSGPTPAPANFSGDVPSVSLVLQVTNASTVFNTVGQTITYSYVVTNTGNSSLAGPVAVSDSKTTVTCPEVNTVGNKDNNLDQTESVTCTASYNITQADLNAGSVANNATARVGGITSNTANAVVNTTANKSLTISTTANPTTYNQAGQNITFTYVVKNIGPTSLGPAQFVVRDERIGTLINCDAPNKVLAANETITCSATTAITQNDMSAGSITSRASASGGGAMTTETVSITVTNTGGSAPSSNYTPGSTIKHPVKAGEWMLQIARCYGADFNAVRNANPQVLDPNKIWPVETLIVPNIGSNGKIYGPPCIEYYTVQSGDTWNSIAQKFNADVAVLMEANRKVSLTNGTKLKIPLNSAGGTQPPPTPGGEAIRITFPAGSSAVTVAGSVNAQSTVRYVVNVAQGQTINIKVIPSVNEVGLGVNSPSNAVLKQVDANLTWSGTTTVSGDHFILISSIAGTTSKTFQLEVSLTNTPPSSVVLVADINSGAGDSAPSFLSVFNGALYFSANGNDGAGTELWKYDSAAKKASRVSDVNQGTGSSDPVFLREYNSALYFRANGNDGAGTELWRFNGSATGRLTDIYSGIGDSNPSFMTVFNNNLYFSANGNDGTGVELWKTDGIAATRVADIYSGAGDSNPSHLVVFNNALYFSAISNDGAGVELWKYDGTNAPVRVSDINSGVGNSNPAYMTVFNNILYFSANGNDGAGTELWKYDGTNFSLAADINAGAGDSIPAYLTVFNNNLYFSANGNDGTGFELWRFNGTNAGRVADINKSGDSNPSFLAVFNNELYFQANGGDGAGRELWKFSGP